MPDTTLFRETTLCAKLEDDALEAIVAAGQDLKLRRGDVLFREDEVPDELFVVVSGRIAIANKSIDGRESMVALMEEGDLFGEMGLFDGRGRSAAARNRKKWPNPVSFSRARRSSRQHPCAPLPARAHLVAAEYPRPCSTRRHAPCRCTRGRRRSPPAPAAAR